VLQRLEDGETHVVLEIRDRATRRGVLVRAAAL